MKAHARYANALTPVPTGFLGSLGAFLHRLCPPTCCPISTPPPALQVAELVKTIQRNPDLSMWIQALVGKSDGVQRALLARATEHLSPSAREILTQMAHPTLRQAVLTALTKTTHIDSRRTIVSA